MASQNNQNAPLSDSETSQSTGQEQQKRKRFLKKSTHKSSVNDAIPPLELIGESKMEPAAVKEVNMPEKREHTLRVRVISGAVYAIVNILAIFWGELPWALVMSFTAGVCCWEFFRLMRYDAKAPNQIIGITFAVLLPILALINMVYLVGAIFLLIMALGIWYVINPRARITDLAVTAFGTIYTGLTLSAIVGIRCSASFDYSGILEFHNLYQVVRTPSAATDLSAILLTLATMLSVWGNDAFAYFIGSKFGKHKLVPKISPKKSWEGLFGGIAGSTIVWCLLLFFPEVGLTVPIALIVGLLCGVTGVIGDLVESRIKRGAGVKDSGNFMPGHGGLLDRSDSLLFAGVTAYFLLRLLGII